MQNSISSIAKLLRSHLHFILIVPALTFGITWPLLAHLPVSDVFWIPTNNPDLYMNFWDVWHGKAVLGGQADFFYTDELFHPLGTTLAFHSYSLPHMLVFGTLQALMSPANAYSLTFLLIIITNALSAYILLNYLVADRWTSLAGAVVFSLNTFIVSHPQHPEVTILVTIPFALYALHRGTCERRRHWLILSAILCGFTAFVGLYIYVCLLLTMGVFTVYLALQRWKERWFWQGILLLMAIAAAISMLRLYPMIADADSLGEALDKNATRAQTNDLLVFVANPKNPIASTFSSTLFNRNPPPLRSDGYLGILPLILVAVGFVFVRNRRKLAPWLFLALFFAILRLGTFLTVDTRAYPEILLPKYFLDSLLPFLFKPFWDTVNFQIGILLPLAILVTYSLTALLRRVQAPGRKILIAIVVFTISFEYFRTPGTGFVLEPSEFEWITWLQGEANQDTIRLINLPMGRQNSKLYGFYQTLHGYPHAEGVAARTPESAYAFIDGNLMLSTWRSGEAINCAADNQADYLGALADLSREGFTHIILHHKKLREETLISSFDSVPSVYHNDYISIWHLSDMQETCAAHAF